MEFSEEQLAEIKAAWDRYWPRTPASERSITGLLAELRPKPKFADGQLVFCEHVDYYHPYDGPRAHEFEMRPLNLRELGPAVKALRDAVVRVSDTGWFDIHGGDAIKQIQILRQILNEFTGIAGDALAQFDKTHGGE